MYILIVRGVENSAPLNLSLAMILLCGKCQRKYEMVGKMIGQPDLEGIFIRILDRDIPGADINICPECAIHALSGTSGFKRKGDIVLLTSQSNLTPKDRRK